VPQLEIDILAYLSALIGGWRLIVASGAACALAVAIYCQFLPDIYEAFVRVGAVDMEDPGGIKPDERRASEILTLVEHGFIMGSSHANFLDVTLARLKSRKYTAAFMEEHGIHRALYPNQWDQTTEAWRPGFRLDEAEAFKRFSEEIRFIEHNPENDIITIRFRWTDPIVAKDWANAFVVHFNDYIRSRTLDEVERKQAYLEAELQKSDVVDIQKSMYRMIEAQTAIEMLANARLEFALEVIDPATVPFDRFSPAPKRLTAYGLLTGAMLAIAFLIGRILFTRFIALLNTLQPPVQTIDGTTLESPL